MEHKFSMIRFIVTLVCRHWRPSLPDEQYHIEVGRIASTLGLECRSAVGTQKHIKEERGIKLPRNSLIQAGQPQPSAEDNSVQPISEIRSLVS
jgi:hypothetical protein